jgi:hypothetical protein
MQAESRQFNQQNLQAKLEQTQALEKKLKQEAEQFDVTTGTELIGVYMAGLAQGVPANVLSGVLDEAERRLKLNFTPEEKAGIKNNDPNILTLLDAKTKAMQSIQRGELNDEGQPFGPNKWGSNLSPDNKKLFSKWLDGIYSARGGITAEGQEAFKSKRASETLIAEAKAGEAKAVLEILNDDNVSASEKIASIKGFLPLAGKTPQKVRELRDTINKNAIASQKNFNDFVKQNPEVSSGVGTQENIREFNRLKAKRDSDMEIKSAMDAMQMQEFVKFMRDRGTDEATIQKIVGLHNMNSLQGE